MGDSIGPTLDAACWRAAETVCQLLRDDLRVAVRGDLEELGASGATALRQSLGTLVRSQTAVWATWHPWLALLGVVLPIGLLLSHVSRWLADFNAVYLWLYINNWTWGYLASAGARSELATIAASALMGAAALVAWSWTSGYILALLSRRALWLTTLLFVVVIMAGQVGVRTPGRMNPSSVVFALPIYRTALPLLVQAMFVLLPVGLGIRRSLSRAPMRVSRALALGIVVTALTFWSAKGLESSVMNSRHLVTPDAGSDRVMGTADDPRPLWPLSVVILWPTWFVVAASRDGRNRRPLSTRIATNAQI